MSRTRVRYKKTESSCGVLEPTEPGSRQFSRDRASKLAGKFLFMNCWEFFLAFSWITYSRNDEKIFKYLISINLFCPIVFLKERLISLLLTGYQYGISVALLLIEISFFSCCILQHLYDLQLYLLFYSFTSTVQQIPLPMRHNTF